MSTSFILIALSSLLSFSLGRTFGRIETGALFNRRLHSIIAAIQKVETLANLKGEDVSKLTSEEIVHRATKQLELKDSDDE